MSLVKVRLQVGLSRFEEVLPDS